MFGAGRPKASPEIEEVRKLTREDILGYVPQPKQNSIQKFRDSHHRIAHLFAMGLRNWEIAEITGYSVVRLSTLRGTPAFEELVESKRPEVEERRESLEDTYFINLIRTRNLAQAEILDRLDDDEKREKFTNQQLLAVSADAMDRTGYPKRTVAMNISGDFASLLEKAIDRSNKVKTIEHRDAPALKPLTQLLDGGGVEREETSAPPSPQPIRRAG